MSRLKYETLDVRLPNNSSIFSAETTVISLALISIKDTVYNKSLIFSASLSVLKFLQHTDHSNPLIQQILRRYFNLSRSKTIIFCWIRSLVSLQGNEPRPDKTNKVNVRPAKTQISLGIRPVWPGSSLCAQWVPKGPSFLHADSKDSDQTGRMPRLIWVFAGHNAIHILQNT